MGRFRSWGVAFLAGLLVCAPSAGAQEGFTLADLSFLSGCWRGEMGSLDMREDWSAVEGGTMLGTTRFLRDDVVVDWEFGRFVEEESGVTLWPYPRGVVSEHGFPLVRIEGEEYVFENLEHDFPVRIVYVRRGEDRLEPRIEGRDGQGPGWLLTRARCPGG
jgi:hypothetical protein